MKNRNVEIEEMARKESTPAGEELVVDLPLDGQVPSRKTTADKFARLSMPSDLCPEELGMLSSHLRSMAEGFDDLARASRRSGKK